MIVSVPGVGGGGLSYFHTYVDLGQRGSKFRILIFIFFGFQKNEYFLGGMKNIFWGAWNSWYFLGWTVDAGPSLRVKNKSE